MRANKKAVIWTATITVVSFIICLFQHSNHNLIYDLSLACFGSALLGIVVAYTAYMAERRDAMEKFNEEVGKAIDVLGNIPVIEISDLVHGALKDENSWIQTTSENRDKLKDYIESRLPINENTSNEQIEKWITSEYQSLLEDARIQLRKGAEAYITVGEFDLSGLNSAYGRLDFLFGNETIRKPAYYNLYDKIRRIRQSCLKRRIMFKSYLAGSGNELVCIDQMQALQNRIFEIRNGAFYAKLRDELLYSLETFRSQTYNIKPEYDEPYPVHYTLSFYDPDYFEKNKRNSEKEKSEGRDERTVIARL